MDAREAVAREEIRDAISRYNHAGDRGRLAELVSCFHENGSLDLAGIPLLVGRSAIEAHLAGVVRDLANRTERAVVRHHVSSIQIEFEADDVARAASYFVVFTEIGLDHWGRYADRFERVDGVWGISLRKVRVDGATPDSRMAASHVPASPGEATA